MENCEGCANMTLLRVPGCSVEVLQNRGPFVFRISSPTKSMQKDIAAPSAEEMEEWISKIRQIAQSANDMVIIIIIITI